MPKKNARKSKSQAAQTKAIPVDEKLLKKLEKEKSPLPTGPMITNAKIFPHILGLMHQYLSFNQHSEASRHFVAELAFFFREEAHRRFKHDTIETFKIAELLKKQIEKVKIGQKDAMTHIMQDYPIAIRLNVYQQTAAEMIQGVWGIFGRGMGLIGGGRDYEKPIGGSGQIIQPAENMSDEQWKHYKGVYTPWYQYAREIEIARREAGPPLTVAGIIFKVLVEDFYPEALDRAFALRQGRSYRVMRTALSHYFKPEGLREALFPPKDAPEDQAPSSAPKIRAPASTTLSQPVLPPAPIPEAIKAENPPK